MGWVGSWVHKFTWQWVGLGWVSYLVGWVGSMKIDPWTTLRQRAQNSIFIYHLCPSVERSHCVENAHEF